MKKKIVCLYICMIFLIPLISATVTANSPPTTPNIDGPTSGKAGVEHIYSLCSYDDDGDELTYCIDWDDGTGEECTGPHPQGACILVRHTWSNQGEYTIKAKASDGQAESDYGELTVIMPRNRAINSFFVWFLQQFPILRYILGL